MTVLCNICGCYCGPIHQCSCPSASIVSMPTDQKEKLLSAFTKHQSGQLAEAEIAYREILEVDPSLTDAWQLLGTLKVQQDLPQEAIAFLEKAISANQSVPQYHVNLGAALSKCNRREEAVAAYKKALALEPNHAEANKNLGIVLCKLKQFEQAIPYLKASSEQGAGQEVVTQLALALALAKKHEQAIPYFEKLYAAAPENRKVLAGFAQSLLSLKEPDERGIELWEKLIEIDPQSVRYRNNLASLLKSLERYDDAIEVCEHGLELECEYLPLICNLGLALAGQKRYEEAKDQYEKAISLWDATSKSVDDAIDESEGSVSESALAAEHACIASTQLAAIENLLGNPSAALQAVERALDIKDDPDSRLVRAFISLGLGNFEEGWQDYESRKETDFAPRKLKTPEWKGERDSNLRVLIHCEQGLGDTWHFIRYAKLVKERVGAVYFLARPPSMPLLRSCPDIDFLIKDGDPLPDHDCNVPLMSLPGVFETTQETIPCEIPYLKADQGLVKKWGNKLAGLEGLKVGICWRGNKEFAYDHFRSPGLSSFKPLADLTGVSLISLQKGEGESEILDTGFDVAFFENLDESEGPFMDTAAIIENLDLIVSSDTAVPHLAGAMGKKVCLALCATPEWRWMTERSDSPWYPSMKLYRQEELSDWEPVFEQIASDVGSLIS